MNLRDEIEQALRSWNAHEVKRGASPVIDFDYHPENIQVEPAAGRLDAYRLIGELRLRAEESGDILLTERLSADRAYLSALMGERVPLTDYVLATQGCPAVGWSADYIAERGEIARKSLDALGIAWGPKLISGLEQVSGPADASDAPDIIRQAASEYESTVRQATGTDAPFDLTIETVDVDAYWAYWLDGAGAQVRLRLNMRNSSFSQAEGRQFALHEVLGHGLQNASYAARCARQTVPWVRMTSVHALHQVMLEGLAQAMPLFVAPDDDILIARVRLAHYTELVKSDLHILVNSGVSVEECAEYAVERVPWWKTAYVGDFLADRGANPKLRSYLWAYPAGLDWFAALAEADRSVIDQVLQAAYRNPLSPADLTALWPAGPQIGGSGRAQP